MIIVPSFLPRSSAEALRFLRTTAARNSPVELRVDGLRDPDFETLLGGRRPPVIVTCRRSVEGGLFEGTPREEAAILVNAITAGAEFVDAEYSLGQGVLRALVGFAGGKRVIISCHDPSGVPAGLVRRFRAMAACHPAFVKIAVHAASFRDTVNVLDVLKEARRSRQQAVAIAMDEFGEYTRILQEQLGGAMTYASFDPARPTAPGQVSEARMRTLYRAGSIDRRTKIFGLLGNPVSQSRGVDYHNAAFRRRRKNAVYVNFLADDPGEFLRVLGDRLSGLSVTMPFKTGIAGHLDALEASSALTGSVNTVVRRSGRLVGYNTDFHAFLALLRKRISPAGKRLVVVGTGGTAATVAGAAAVSGARLTIAGRNPARARRLADRFGAEWIPLADVREHGGDILVNATPVGMAPGPGRGTGARILPASALGPFGLVCDFANPPGATTRLVHDATSRGIAVITGLQIFETQARLQSERFLAIA